MHNFKIRYNLVNTFLNQTYILAVFNKKTVKSDFIFKNKSFFTFVTQRFYKKKIFYNPI